MRSGSTLLELVIVAGLVGVIGVAIILSLTLGLKMSTQSKNYIRASQIVTDELEALRAKTFATINTPYNGALLTAAGELTDLPQGTGTLVTSYYNSPTNTIKQLSVTVSWNEKGRSQSIQDILLIANKGLSP